LWEALLFLAHLLRVLLGVRDGRVATADVVHAHVALALHELVDLAEHGGRPVMVKAVQEDVNVGAMFDEACDAAEHCATGRGGARRVLRQDLDHRRRHLLERRLGGIVLEDLVARKGLGVELVRKRLEEPCLALLGHRAIARHLCQLVVYEDQGSVRGCRGCAEHQLLLISVEGPPEGRKLVQVGHCQNEISNTRRLAQRGSVSAHDCALLGWGRRGVGTLISHRTLRAQAAG